MINHKYSVACITSLESNKTPTAVSREIGIHQTSMSRMLQVVDCTVPNLKDLVKKMFGKRRVSLVGDDTVIPRPYSEETEGTSLMRDHSTATKSFTNGYKIVVIGLTDGKVFLPIDVEQWIAEFIMQDAYLKTYEIAQLLISRFYELGISIKSIVMDGGFFVKNFLFQLNDEGKNFVVKAKTTTCVSHKGVKVQLQNCKDLRLNSYQSCKTILAKWNGVLFYFTAVRREGKHGPKIIYLISSFKAKPRTYAEIYDSRWTIEKCFRTTKRSMGLKDSTSQYARTYMSHVKHVLYGYTLVQLFMKKYRLKSVEDAIREIQSLKSDWDFNQIADRLSLLTASA